jgi:hypothetical protein
MNIECVDPFGGIQPWFGRFNFSAEQKDGKAYREGKEQNDRWLLYTASYVIGGSRQVTRDLRHALSVQLARVQYSSSDFSSTSPA